MQERNFADTEEQRGDSEGDSENAVYRRQRRSRVFGFDG